MVGFDFLKLHMAEEDKLVKITFDDDIDGVATVSYLEEMKALYVKVFIYVLQVFIFLFF